MCITNQMSDEILKQIREIEKDGVKNIPSVDLAKFLAQVKILTDCLEIVEKQVRAEYNEREEGEVFYFPDLKKKVYLAEGRSSTTYYAKDIYEDMIKNKIGDHFFDIINIVQKKIEDSGYGDKINQIVNKHKLTAKGDPAVTVMKMSKLDLVEHTNK